MEYIYLAPLFIILYMVAVDKNLAEYLYLKLLNEPVIALQTAVLKYRLLFSLRYDRFLMGRGIVPRRFYQMAEQIRNESGADPK
jgi:hypothetical protein